jgi:hypothetical protein
MIGHPRPPQITRRNKWVIQHHQNSLKETKK